MNIDEFVNRYPKLYHMAEANTWEHIKNFGLLSTSAILDLHKINGNDRLQYESMHRPEMIGIGSNFAPTMSLRDQKPMSDMRLFLALAGSSTPRQWYELLNQRVFLWATEARLTTLLSAKHYKNTLHDVLTIDSASFVSMYASQIELCHMNSGNTFPIPHRRTPEIFQPIHSYPVKPSGAPIRDVAEVTVLYAVPDMSSYVKSVDLFRGPTFIENIYATS
jgi:hypothetical protein